MSVITTTSIVQNPAGSQNILVSFNFDGFTCTGVRVARFNLFRESPNVSVGILQTTPSTTSSGTASATFTNIARGYSYYCVCSLICDNNRVPDAVAQTIVLQMTGGTDPDPLAGSGGGTLPGSTQTGVTCTDTAPNSNPTRCINTGGTNISFSGLNQLFGRPAQLANTRLSGLSNPSGADSLIGISYLPLDVVTPGKLRQNAVSEFRGQCNYARPDQYSLAIVITSNVTIFQESPASQVTTKQFNVYWVHPLSGIITKLCPFDNTVVRVTLTARTWIAYVGSTMPLPNSITITKRLANGTAASGYPITVSQSPTIQGINSSTIDIPLSLNESIDGSTVLQKAIISTQSYRHSLNVTLLSNTHTVLNGLCTIPGSGSDVFDQIIFNPTLTTFTYTWRNSASGVGVSSTLDISGILNNTTSTSSGGDNITSGSTGNRSVTVTPSPSSAYSTLVITQNGSVIFNQTNIGQTTTTVNFQAGFIYEIFGSSTSSVQ